MATMKDEFLAFTQMKWNREVFKEILDFLVFLAKKLIEKREAGNIEDYFELPDMIGGPGLIERYL